MHPEIHLSKYALFGVLSDDHIPAFLDRLLVSDTHESRVGDFLDE